MRTGGSEPASWAEHGRDDPLIKLYERYEREAKYLQDGSH